MLTRLKVAFALAVLHGRSTIGEAEWKIAGDLIDVSVRVRAQMRTAVDDARRRQNTAKAHDRAEREQIVTERLADHAQRRVVKAIFGKLRRVERATRAELLRGCAADVRSEFGPVFEMLLDKHIIAACGQRGQRFSTEYEIGPEYDRSV